MNGKSCRVLENLFSRVILLKNGLRLWNNKQHQEEKEKKEGKTQNLS